MTKKRLVTRDNVEQIVEELLDLPFWPTGIKSMTRYKVQTDDTDGDPTVGWLTVVIGPDGDAHVSATARDGIPDEIRFRTFAGGGSHLRVRNACLILAVAMKKDMEGEGNQPWDSFSDDDEES